MNTSGKLVAFWPLNDWSSLQKMDANHFPRPWTLEQWRTLAESNHRLYLWKQGETILGFALLAHFPGDETAHLLKICLEPQWRGQGVANTFWQNILDDLKTVSVRNVYLEVEESNQRAQNFYIKVGFKTVRMVKSYYSDGENGIMMLMSL